MKRDTRYEVTPLAVTPEVRRALVALLRLCASDSDWDLDGDDLDECVERLGFRPSDDVLAFMAAEIGAPRDLELTDDAEDLFWSSPGPDDRDTWTARAKEASEGLVDDDRLGNALVLARRGEDQSVFLVGPDALLTVSGGDPDFPDAVPAKVREETLLAWTQRETRRLKRLYAELWPDHERERTSAPEGPFLRRTRVTVESRRVRHAKFGEGTLIDFVDERTDRKLVIDFDGVGRKTLLERFVTMLP